ncbi:MAG: ribosomal protein S18-alanine N-acetyltransferase [Clostridia bacterium]|nr:ribosomal protein S18-alanine N-acetyltransferase [Clostridia bacterium]
MTDINELNTPPATGDKQKKPKLHPARMQKTPAHLNGAAELEKLCFSSPWSASSLELLTNDGIGVGYVITASVAPGAEPTVAAYGGMLITVDEGQITNIAVHPDHRRKGYGAAITRALLRHAKDAKLDSVSLEVRASNTAAIELYKKAGFTEAGRRKGFYTKPTEDALVMVCKIK